MKDDKEKRKEKAKGVMSILFKSAGRVKDKGVKSGKDSIAKKINWAGKYRKKDK